MTNALRTYKSFEEQTEDLKVDSGRPETLKNRNY
jgi:hypothetical protein